MSVGVRSIDQIEEWIRILVSERSVTRNYIKTLRKERGEIESIYTNGMMGALEWSKKIRDLDEKVESLHNQIEELDRQIRDAQIEIANLEHEDEEAWAQEDRSGVPGWGEFG